MDLDPTNVLVGERRMDEQDPEHLWSPIVKIADFGLMIDWDDKWTLEDRKRLIRRGKANWLTPEQRAPGTIFARGDVVDSRFNVWSIGTLMLNLLTLGHPESEKLEWLPEVRTLDLADFGQPIRMMNVLTWGSVLIRNAQTPHDFLGDFIDSYDIELRNLIARCMCDDAHNRPTLEALTRLIQRQIERVDARLLDYVLLDDGTDEVDPEKPPYFESDRLLAKFYSDYFYEPLVTDDPYADYWSDGTPPGAMVVPSPPPPRGLNPGVFRPPPGPRNRASSVATRSDQFAQF
ncbi:D-xylose reductase [Hypoxylon texense]